MPIIHFFIFSLYVMKCAYYINLSRVLIILVVSLNESVYSKYFKWEPLNEFNEIHNTSSFKHIESQELASNLLNGQNVYLSLTTISNRLNGIAETIGSIIVGTVIPNHIYIFLSKTPFLLDKGISADEAMFELSKVSQLKRLYPNISVIFTDNIGPHRKLVPLLENKWSEDCVIITIDDHEIYQPTTLAGLLWYYTESGGDAVIAHRSRRMSICNKGPPWKLSPYSGVSKGLWPVAQLSIREKLILPTGFAGILYRPRFFNQTLIFDRNLINITKTGDDLMFRLVTFTQGIDVVTSCTEETVDPGFSCPLYPSSKISNKIILNTNYDKFSKLTAKNSTYTRIVDNILSTTTNVSIHNLRYAKRGKARSKEKHKVYSLASHFNFRGGNDKMWLDAINYLYSNNIFDFNNYLQDIIKIERKECFDNSIIKLITMSYDVKCGMITC